jgi:hypothetical protein
MRRVWFSVLEKGRHFFFGTWDVLDVFLWTCWTFSFELGAYSPCGSVCLGCWACFSPTGRVFSNC